MVLQELVMTLRYKVKEDDGSMTLPFGVKTISSVKKLNLLPTNITHVWG